MLPRAAPCTHLPGPCLLAPTSLLPPQSGFRCCLGLLAIFHSRIELSFPEKKCSEAGAPWLIITASWLFLCACRHLSLPLAVRTAAALRHLPLPQSVVSCFWGDRLAKPAEIVPGKPEWSSAGAGRQRPCGPFCWSLRWLSSPLESDESLLLEKGIVIRKGMTMDDPYSASLLIVLVVAVSK